ncbi:hypothetical protein E2562_034213 [Oryza meyeriana var. granulata]|uniref:Uncharacterized protein n=1 Tax=Oryza meyeriana var. granulata TaxID=110450 RepID=A0A6G1CAD4_9ORYZ|nr:hypothetical protein E2562_034213 [Oryza meyeriana var. granulata]
MAFWRMHLAATEPLPSKCSDSSCQSTTARRVHLGDDGDGIVQIVISWCLATARPSLPSGDDTRSSSMPGLATLPSCERGGSLIGAGRDPSRWRART